MRCPSQLKKLEQSDLELTGIALCIEGYIDVRIEGIEMYVELKERKKKCFVAK